MGGTAFVVDPLSLVIWRAPAFPSDLACSRDLGFCHGRTRSGAISTARPCYLRKVWGYIAALW